MRKRRTGKISETNELPHKIYVYPIFHSNSESESQCILTAFHPEFCIHNKRMNSVYAYTEEGRDSATTNNKTNNAINKHQNNTLNVLQSEARQFMDDFNL